MMHQKLWLIVLLHPQLLGVSRNGEKSVLSRIRRAETGLGEENALPFPTFSNALPDPTIQLSSILLRQNPII